MDIDSEHLGIPDTEYCATVTMPAGEYARICKDLSSIGDTGGCRRRVAFFVGGERWWFGDGRCKEGGEEGGWGVLKVGSHPPRSNPTPPLPAVVVSATKDGVKFTTTGDVGTANVTVRQNTTADKVRGGWGVLGRELSACIRVRVSGFAFARASHPLKTHHTMPTNLPTPYSHAPQKEDQTTIDLKEPVALNFALRYLTSFSKATPLATHVTLSMTRELPVMVGFGFFLGGGGGRLAGRLRLEGVSAQPACVYTRSTHSHAT
jgi:proliferating cell nuclear antigen